MKLLSVIALSATLAAALPLSLEATAARALSTRSADRTASGTSSVVRSHPIRSRCKMQRRDEGDSQGQTGVETAGQTEGNADEGGETDAAPPTGTDTPPQATATGDPLPSGTSEPASEGTGAPDPPAGPDTQPSPDGAAAPPAGQWTITGFRRTCDAADSACEVEFGINTGEGGSPTACRYTQAGGSRAAVQGQTCGAFTVGAQWSGQFGEGHGFTTLLVVDTARKLIVWPAYTDTQLEGGQVVTPDQSYPPASLP